MNLKGRYNMLRQATLAMIGIPDDVEQLKAMAVALAIPSLTDADAAMSRLLVQTLVATHDAEAAAKPTEATVTGPTPKAAFDCILHQLRIRYPLPNGSHKITLHVTAYDDGYALTDAKVVDEATARRLDDYLGGEFDIRIGKQAAHAALVHALAQDRASQVPHD